MTDTDTDTDTAQPVSTPFFDKDILKMSVDELEQHVLLIRTRREAAAMRIEQAIAVSRGHKEGALAYRLERQIKQCNKELERADKVIEKLEALITKVRVTLIELGE